MAKGKIICDNRETVLPQIHEGDLVYVESYGKNSSRDKEFCKDDIFIVTEIAHDGYIVTLVSATNECIYSEGLHIKMKTSDFVLKRFFGTIKIYS